MILANGPSTAPGVLPFRPADLSETVSDTLGSHCSPAAESAVATAGPYPTPAAAEPPPTLPTTARVAITVPEHIDSGVGMARAQADGSVTLRSAARGVWGGSTRSSLIPPVIPPSDRVHQPTGARL